MHQEVITFLIASGSYVTASGDITATFRGHLYEGVMHKYLMDGGDFTVKSLKTGKLGELSIPRATKKENFKQLTPSFEPKVYYQPCSSRFPVIDSLFCSSSGDVMLFQITIADNHPIIHHHLEDIVERLQSYRIQFYFVILEDTFSTFKSQNYVTNKGTNILRINPKVEAIEQNTLCISLDNPVLSKQ